jgi:hypothetical protein
MTKDQEKAMSKEQLKLFSSLTKLQKALRLGVLSGLTQRQAYKQAVGQGEDRNSHGHIRGLLNGALPVRPIAV